MELSEKKIEDVFEVFYKKLVSDDLELVGRQMTIEGLRVDLLFKDGTGKHVVIELKRDAITREDVGQAMEYAGLVQNSRVILAAPIIASTIKQAFDHYGIEYLEFDPEQILKLYGRIKGKANAKRWQDVSIPTSVIREPLVGRRKKDGNIAFKVTYVDSGWNGVCSDRLYQYNILHRVWCKTQKPECRRPKYKTPHLHEVEYPCYDCIAMRALRFESGFFHNGAHAGQPIRCLQAKQGKLAFFTSREPGTKEDERFVFAIAQISHISAGNQEEPETFFCESETAMTFERPPRPRFWNSYKNASNPHLVGWDTGLFRYVSDSTARHFLNSVLNDRAYSPRIRKAAKLLIRIVE